MPPSLHMYRVSLKASPGSSGSVLSEDDRLPTALHGCAALAHIMTPPRYTCPGSDTNTPDCSGSLRYQDDRLPTALHGCAALAHIMAPPRRIVHGHANNMRHGSADALLPEAPYFPD